jgi:hypothetical protein
MARDHARINLAIWNDDDFLDLPPAAQHLYLILWTHPDLSFAGVVDWHPPRLAARASGWTTEDVILAGKCLEARLFIVIDEETQECLIRSWARWDGLMKQPILAVSFAKARAGVASRDIRAVLVHEAQKLRKLEPDLPGWAKPQVQELLSNRALDPRRRERPTDPLTPGLTPALTPALTVRGGVDLTPALTPPLLLSPSPTPLLRTLPDAGASEATQEAPPEKPSRRKPERPLPDDWAPGPKHFQQAETKGLNLTAEARAFRNHAATHDRRARDWDAAFRTWLDKSKPTTAGRTPGKPRDQLPW